LALLAAASVLLRAQGIGSWFWIDEGLTVGLSRADLVDIPGLLRADGSPPLYYVLLHLWMLVAGSKEVATHAFSLLLATLTIPAGFFAGSRVFGRRAGWVAAGLFAFNPFLTHFSRETRMYTLVVLLGLVVVAAFVDGFVIRRRMSCVVFAVALTALLYTHNWALYVAAAAVAALVPAALAAERPREIIRDGVAALGAVGLAYVPWFLVLLGQIGDTGAPWSYTPTAREVVWEVSALVRDERVLLLLAVVAGGALVHVFQRPRTQEGAIAWVLVIFTLAPVGLGWVVAHVEPSWATRYLAVVVAPMMLFAAWGLARAGAVGVLALLVGVALWVQPLARLEGGLTIDAHGKSDGKALAAELDERLGVGDLVIVAQPEAVPLFALYMEEDVRFATLYGGELDDPAVMDWRGAQEKLQGAQPSTDLLPLLRSLEPGQRVALVGPGGRLVRTDTDWIRTFHRKHAIWLSVLRSGEYERVGRVNPRLDGVAVPFIADVFEITGEPVEQ
jgi:mannosyltransferase